MDAFLDVDALEKAESQIDQFIEKRARDSEEHRRMEAEWAESTRRHRHKVRLANGHAWVRYFDRLASCHERQCLVGERREKAEADLVRMGASRES